MATDFVLLERTQVPPSNRAGYQCSLPIVDTKRYLPYLEARLLSAGGRLELKTVLSFSDLDGLVVNCSGLGARELAQDCDLFAIRGQVVVVDRTALCEFLLDSDNPAGVVYVVPRQGDIVLGGVAQDRDESFTVRDSETESIRARCSAYFPELRTAAIREVKVGLRPGRATVRLADEILPSGKRVIHNYGHGGAGFTLSWGCAKEVLAIATR